MTKILALLNPFKWYLLGGLLLLLVALTWTVDNWRVKANLYESEKLAHFKDNAACEKAKKLTSEASNELQTRYDDISSKLTTAKLQHPARCLPVLTSTPIDRGNTGQLPRPYGVLTGDLRDFAADCERVRSSLIVVNNFLDGERK